MADMPETDDGQQPWGRQEWLRAIAAAAIAIAVVALAYRMGDAALTSLAQGMEKSCRVR